MKSALPVFVALPLLLLGFAVTTPAAAQTAPAKDARIRKSDILKHPIGQLALKYADALHNGNMDEAMKLASGKAQARWKSDPESERMESADYLRKTIPNRAGLAAGIEAGGVLIIEGGARATLNVVKLEVDSSKSGVVQSSSSTIALPFVLEGGQWRIAQ